VRPTKHERRHRDQRHHRDHGRYGQHGGQLEQLGGIPPQGFMSSSRFAFGSASTDAATPVPLFSLEASK
jgi:hypothetical protein